MCGALLKEWDMSDAGYVLFILFTEGREKKKFCEISYPLENENDFLTQAYTCNTQCWLETIPSTITACAIKTEAEKKKKKKTKIFERRKKTNKFIPKDLETLKFSSHDYVYIY